jgi:hypothetical protein
MKTRFMSCLGIMLIAGQVLFVPAAFCSITNNGDMDVRVVVTHRDGRSSSVDLYPGQETPLPADAVQVKVDSYRVDRGDDQVYVSVVSPDGSEGSINDFGGVYKVSRN